MDGTSPPQLDGLEVESHDLTPTWEQVGNVVVFKFTALGTPKPKARPRVVRRGNFINTYTPATTVNWEQTIVWQARQAMTWVAVNFPGEVAAIPFANRILADIRFNIVKPKSTPKSVRFPLKAQPGDVDNLAKSVLDALQLAGTIVDDKTVTDLTVSKRYVEPGHPEGVEIELTAWVPNAPHVIQEERTP
jgi:Holliday junction resolvase RusA-like endonuclease